MTKALDCPSFAIFYRIRVTGFGEKEIYLPIQIDILRAYSSKGLSGSPSLAAPVASKTFAATLATMSPA